MLTEREPCWENQVRVHPGRPYADCELAEWKMEDQQAEVQDDGAQNSDSVGSK